MSVGETKSNISKQGDENSQGKNMSLRRCTFIISVWYKIDQNDMTISWDITNLR